MGQTCQIILKDKAELQGIYDKMNVVLKTSDSRAIEHRWSLHGGNLEENHRWPDYSGLPAAG
jgi:hypothetical protein